MSSRSRSTASSGTSFESVHSRNFADHVLGIDEADVAGDARPAISSGSRVRLSLARRSSRSACGISMWKSLRTAAGGSVAGTATGPRFVPREPPGPDVAAFVTRGVDIALFHYRARVTVHAPAAEVVGYLPAAVVVEAIDDQTCLVHAGADTPHLLAAHIVMLNLDFEVTEPPELIKALRTIFDRCRRATTRPRGPVRGRVGSATEAEAGTGEESGTHPPIG